MTEKEIRVGATKRLEVLVEGCRQSPALSKAVVGTVTLDIPSCFKGQRQRETFECPEISGFAKAVMRRVPGFSLLIDFNRDLTYKNLLLSSLSLLTVIRKGADTTLHFPEAEWDQLINSEIGKADDLARHLQVPAVARYDARQRIREALSAERF
jgi:hypothetical protein